MDDSKRRVLIRSQVAKKKETGDVAPKGMSSGNSSIKRKQPTKGVHLAKKVKIPLEPMWV